MILLIPMSLLAAMALAGGPVEWLWFAAFIISWLLVSAFLPVPALIYDPLDDSLGSRFRREPRVNIERLVLYRRHIQLIRTPAAAAAQKRSAFAWRLWVGLAPPALFQYAPGAEVRRLAAQLGIPVETGFDGRS